MGKEGGHCAELLPQESCAWFPKWQTSNLNTFSKSFSVDIQSNVWLCSSIWWGPHSLCHLPTLRLHTRTWGSTSPPPQPEVKPVFSHHIWILPPHLQHWAMAGRGGTTRTNGTAANSKICQFKLVLLGESAVGKSSLVLRFVKGQFHEYQESTIGGTALCLICRKQQTQSISFTSQYAELEENMSLPVQNGCKLVGCFLSLVAFDGGVAEPVLCIWLPASPMKLPHDRGVHGKRRRMWTLLMVLHCWVYLAVWVPQRSSEVIWGRKELRQQWLFPGPPVIRRSWLATS